MMNILHKIVVELSDLNNLPPLDCNALGPIDSTAPKTLSYVASPKFIDEANNNKNINTIITNKNIAPSLSNNKHLIIVNDPTWLFWSLFNQVTSETKTTNPTIIHPEAKIHSSSFISEHDVKIGSNTIVEPNVTIHPNVIIGKNCIIRSGTVCGFDGFEHKRTDSGIVSVQHDGCVFIEDNVEIGSLNSIARGFSWRNTIIQSNTKTDSMVHIAHGVRIGRNCLITACAEISGSVDIGDDCWLGPNCSIINGISLGKNVYIGIGAVVTKPFPENSVAAGNPARLLRTQ